MKVFKEEQRFTQSWLILVLAVSTIVPITLICKKYFAKHSAMTISEFVISIMSIVAITSLIFIFKLTTIIDEKGIQYKFFPFHFNSKIISWDKILKAYVKTYDPIGDFGGWGLKGGFLWNKKKGKAINVSGDIGIQLELKSGKKLLLGTKKQDEAIYILKKYHDKISSNV